MKKYLFLFCLINILFSACLEEEIQYEDVKADANDTVYVSLEDVADTRTILDGKKILWSDGDDIVAFMGKTLRRRYVVDAKTVGTTEGTFVRDADYEHIGSSNIISNNVAFYPFAELTCLAEGDNYVLDDVVLPSEQSYLENSFGLDALPMMAVSADTDDSDFSFKNVCGAVKIQLVGSAKVKFIRISGHSDEILSGKATVTSSFRGVPELVMYKDGEASVTLDCGDGVLLNKNEPVQFIIVLPPVTFENGFTVVVEDTCGNTQEYSTSKKNVISRSSILKMPVREFSCVEDIEMNDYIDEYGINRGKGVLISGTVWAPVDCGYHETDYKYGKLYQWGRRFGQGYDGELCDGYDEYKIGTYKDAITPNVVSAGELSYGWFGQLEENANNFYYMGYNWFSSGPDNLWNSGTEENPQKTNYDPCPAGWRVPTFTELEGLCTDNIFYTKNEDGIRGCWLSGDVKYDETAPRVFFPMAGIRYFTTASKGQAIRRGASVDYWSSTVAGAGSPNHSSYMAISYDDDIILGATPRAYGHSVRCVQDKSDFIPIDRVELNKSYVALSVGDKEQLNVTVLPLNSTDQQIYWFSDMKIVAKVTDDGIVTAVEPGTAIIFAIAGTAVSVCVVKVSDPSQPPIQMKDYVDEFGINHGKGIEIGNYIWAPVNCGYHKDDFKYGKLYQWGRKYGQGYSGRLHNTNGYLVGEYSDAYAPLIKEGGISAIEGSNVDNKDVFYTAKASSDYNWCDLRDDKLWNSGTEENPIKTEYDPCPEGWRVPSHKELMDLMSGASPWTINEDGLPGRWFCGQRSYAEYIPQMFLPAAGGLYADGEAKYREYSGNYWTSCPIDSKYVYDGSFTINSAGGRSGYYRACAYSVRCIQE